MQDIHIRYLHMVCIFPFPSNSTIIERQAFSESHANCLSEFSVCPSNGVNLIFARAINFPQHPITKEVSLLKMKSTLLILS
jgi:hypothetical protein